MVAVGGSIQNSVRYLDTTKYCVLNLNLIFKCLPKVVTSRENNTYKFYTKIFNIGGALYISLTCNLLNAVPTTLPVERSMAIIETPS